MERDWEKMISDSIRADFISEDLAAAFLSIAYTHYNIVKIPEDDRAECFDRAYDRLRQSFKKLDPSKAPTVYLIQMVKYAIKDFYKACNTNKRSILRKAKPLEHYE